MRCSVSRTQRRLESPIGKNSAAHGRRYFPNSVDRSLAAAAAQFDCRIQDIPDGQLMVGSAATMVGPSWLANHCEAIWHQVTAERR